MRNSRCLCPSRLSCSPSLYLFFVDNRYLERED
jgi:hypothetical protein